MSFEPITTQEQLDGLLQTARAETEQRYAGYLSPEAVQQQYHGWMSPEDQETLRNQHQTELQERDDKIQSYEAQSLRNKVARETGLPVELAEKLSGADEAAMRTDAEAMLRVIGKHRGGDPSVQAEPTPDAKAAAYKNLAANL